jgi:3-dehydroquinate dehydratase-2
MLGTREPKIYGNKSFNDYYRELKDIYKDYVYLDYKQTNHEGSIIDILQQANQDCYDGVILNAGAYSHTSIAIRDAIESISVPVVEVHISNIYAREDFRRTSVISPVCKGIICGFGLEGYQLAIKSFVDNI